MLSKSSQRSKQEEDLMKRGITQMLKGKSSFFKYCFSCILYCLLALLLVSFMGGIIAILLICS
jgi:hypothetical protein